MDYQIELRYFVEKVSDYARALEEFSGELHATEENRILFRVAGRPFEALAWISEEHDLITITTRTADFPVTQFEDAVTLMQATLEICWDHCVAMTPVETRYDLSMALFVGGCTFEAFEGVIYNLLSCAEAIEEQFKHGKKP
jgi:hypothetical protein